MSDFIKRLGAYLNGDSLIDIGALPPELRAPIEPFLRPGARYITVREARIFYDQCTHLLKAREALYRQEATTVQAAAAVQPARALTAFVQRLDSQKLALLQMRMEERARLDFARVEQRNAELERELSHFRQLTYAPTRDED